MLLLPLGLDYFNTLYGGLDKSSLHCFKTSQKAAAHLLTGAKKT